MINDTPKKNLNKYFTEDYFDKTFGSDPNKKITFKEMLEKLPEEVGREFVKRGNALFGPISGEFSCYDCTKEGKKNE
tara:strand:- start:533 stop:763 length:231 start_codon:yes stop_codon:yes gene_type:complete